MAENDIENIEEKEIFESHLHVKNLQYCLQRSCFADKCHFLNYVENDYIINEIYDGLLALLDNERKEPVQETSTLLTTISIVYGMNRNVQDFERFGFLLYKLFHQISTIDPGHIQIFTKTLWAGFNPSNASQVLKLVDFCQVISVLHYTGNAIALSMMWLLLDQITENEHKTYFLKEFSVLPKMFEEIDEELLLQEDEIEIIHVLIEVISFLLNAILDKNTKAQFLTVERENAYDESIYEKYFLYTNKDLRRVKNWCEQVLYWQKMSAKEKNDFCQLRMMVVEKLTVLTIPVLKKKLSPNI